MANKIEMREVQQNDFDSLSSLYVDVYDINLNRAYWNWKYFENPAGEPCMFVALEGDRTVGETGTIPATVLYKNEHTPASQSCDITVHPDYQKGGTFLRLAKLSINKCIKDKLLFIYGFSVPVTLKVSTKLLKFRSVCSVWRWLLIVNPRPYLSRKIRLNFLTKAAAAIISPIIKIKLLRHCVKTENHITEIKKFDERFDVFWEKRKQEFNITVVRDSTYLNWRYFKNPNGHYKVYAYIQENEIRGFIILTVEQDEIRRGFIMDIIIDPADQSITEQLMSTAIKYFIEEKAEAVMTWLPKWSPLVGQIEKWGFKSKKTDHNIIVRLTRDEKEVDPEYIYNPDNWYFTMGDSDYH